MALIYPDFSGDVDITGYSRINAKNTFSSFEKYARSIMLKNKEEKTKKWKYFETMVLTDTHWTEKVACRIQADSACLYATHKNQSKK